jgi:hypothetical protein
MKQHLIESNMTYWQHLAHSLKQSGRLFAIAIKSIVHGILPWFFVNSGPIGVYRIYKEIRKLHHVQRIFKNEK